MVVFILTAYLVGMVSMTMPENEKYPIFVRIIFAGATFAYVVTMGFIAYETEVELKNLRESMSELQTPLSE